MESKVSEWRPGPTVCRCCLSEGCYKDISTEYFWMGKREVYAEMLSETLDLSISYSASGGPNSNSRLICENCIARLRDATDFKRQVQECEKTFIQHIDGGANITDAEVQVESAYSKPVKVEDVKLEKRGSDDDFDDRGDFLGADDDDDDLDDQPLTKIASRTPKKETVDILDLLDNAKAAEKRKSTTKTKTPPAKKLKKKEPLPKPSASKTLSSDKKKKGQHRSLDIENTEKNNQGKVIVSIGNATSSKKRAYERSAKSMSRLNTKNNANIIIKCWTVCPFRWKKNVFKCAYCDEEHSEYSSLREHVRSCFGTHTIRDIYIKFREMSPINVDITDAVCRFCSKPLVDVEQMRTHIKQHGYDLNPEHPDGVIPFKLDEDCWKCTICDEEFNNFFKLYQHMNSHYQHYICTICGKGLMTALRLRNHLDVHVTGSFPCGECGKVFKLRSSLTCHRYSIHSKANKYVCPKCGMRFEGYYDRIDHLRKAHSEKAFLYKCPHCKMEFKTSGKRSSHVRSVHFLAQRTHSCPDCDWQFSTASQLKKHMSKHSGERNFSCCICGKSYLRRYNLTEHMRTHENFKGFDCASCGRRFKRKNKLSSHISSKHSQIATDVGSDDRVGKSDV